MPWGYKMLVIQTSFEHPAYNAIKKHLFHIKPKVRYVQTHDPINAVFCLLARMPLAPLSPLALLRLRLAL